MVTCRERSNKMVVDWVQSSIPVSPDFSKAEIFRKEADASSSRTYQYFSDWLAAYHYQFQS